MDDSVLEEQDRKADKRKRAASSSVSELDTSKEYGGSEGESLSEGSSLSRKNKRKKKKKEFALRLGAELVLIPEKTEETEAKTTKVTQKEKKKEKEHSGNKAESGTKGTKVTEVTQIETKQSEANTMEKELNEIKALLQNVMTKSDETLKTTIKETMLEMKDEILKSITHKIEIVEGDLHDQAVEINTLKTDVKNLKKICSDQEAENKTLRKEIEASSKKHEKLVSQRANELEQYQRRNNIRISGINDSADEKTASRPQKKSVTN